MSMPQETIVKTGPLELRMQQAIAGASRAFVVVEKETTRTIASVSLPRNIAPMTPAELRDMFKEAE